MEKEQIASIAKWAAITILGLTIIFLFRGEIASILNRTKSVSISSEGVTLETPLGTTDVTRQTSTETYYRQTYPAPQFDTFFKPQDGYVISRPVGSRLKTVEELGQDFEIIKNADGFSFALMAISENDWDAMITVRIYEAPGLDINLAVQGFFDAAGPGIEYGQPAFDERTQSATLFGHDKQSSKIFVSRVYLKDGRLYDLRAAFAETISEDLKSQLNIVMNSFFLLSS